MLEETINISFPVKANILLSLKETKEQFTQDLLYIDDGGRKASFDHPHPSPLPQVEGKKCRFTSSVIYMSALMLYRKNRLSLGKAAELAGYTKLDFIEKLKIEHEPIFDYGEQELDEIFADSNKLEAAFRKKRRVPPPQFAGKVREVGDFMSSIPPPDWGIDEESSENVSL
ncbi:UPF0175 family protein [Methylomagnum sp.]